MLLREGLRRQARPRAKPYRTRPRELGLRPGFDAVRLNQLADELDVDGRLETESRDGGSGRFDGLRWRNTLVTAARGP